MPHTRKPASDLLLDTVRDWPGESITVEELTGALGDRAFGVAMMLFALPNCLPAPPGMNSVFGLPLLLYAGQMAVGRRSPWQPKFISRRTLKRSTMLRLLEAAVPKLKWVEKLCRPRMTYMVGPRGEKLLALFIVLLSLCVMLPLWGTNFVPAVGAVLISIAIIERDGLLAVVGLAVGLAGVLLTFGIFWSLVAASRAIL